MLCNHQQILGIVLSSTNHIRCKFTLGHLFFFFCSQKYDSKRICLLRARMIYFGETCGNIGIGWNITLDNFIRCTCWSRKKNAYEALNYRHISLNCSFRKSKINPYNDCYRKYNFPDVFYFGVNHPLLVHNQIMTIAIRVFFKFNLS